MSDFLERDENYEPATLPTAGEILHWGDLHSPAPVDAGPVGFPEAKPPVLGPDGTPLEPELTRFIPRPQPGRYVVASLVTAGVFVGIAIVVALTAGATGPKGVGAFLGVIGAVVAGLAITLGVWRWAGRRRIGIPTKRASSVEDQEGGPTT